MTPAKRTIRCIIHDQIGHTAIRVNIIVENTYNMWVTQFGEGASFAQEGSAVLIGLADSQQFDGHRVAQVNMPSQVNSGEPSRSYQRDDTKIAQLLPNKVLHR